MVSGGKSQAGSGFVDAASAVAEQLDSLLYSILNDVLLGRGMQNVGKAFVQIAFTNADPAAEMMELDRFMDILLDKGDSLLDHQVFMGVVGPRGIGKVCRALAACLSSQLSTNLWRTNN